MRRIGIIGLLLLTAITTATVRHSYAIEVINPHTNEIDYTGVDVYDTDCSSYTSEAMLCWDTDDDILYIGDGTASVPATDPNVTTATSVIADNTVVRGDGGARGVQGSNATLDDVGNLTVTSDVIVGDELYVAQYIKHTGDTDTSIEFIGDQFRFNAGGYVITNYSAFMHPTIPLQYYINNDRNDLDFSVSSDNATLIYTDGSADELWFGGTGLNKITVGSTALMEFDGTADIDLPTDSVDEADLKAVNAATDEDILTYESTTGDFEWHTPAELGIITSEADTLQTVTDRGAITDVSLWVTSAYGEGVGFVGVGDVDESPWLSLYTDGEGTATIQNNLGGLNIIGAEGEAITLTTNDLIVDGTHATIGDSGSGVDSVIDFLSVDNSGSITWSHNDSVFTIVGGIINYTDTLQYGYGVITNSCIIGTLVTNLWQAYNNSTIDLTNSSDTTLSIQNSGDGVAHVTVDGNVTADSLITQGGTSSQFVKGDGSLDSSTFLTAEADTLQTVTTRGATTDQSITVNSVSTFADDNGDSPHTILNITNSAIPDMAAYSATADMVFKMSYDDGVGGTGTAEAAKISVFKEDSWYGSGTRYGGIRFGVVNNGTPATALSIDSSKNSSFSGNISSTGSLSGTSGTFTGLTASQLVATDATKKLQTLATATYPSLTELSYVKGATSAIQTQINAKAPSTSPTFATSITGSYLTASTILSSNASKQIVSLSTSTYPSLTELSYVKGVTSAVQTQLGSKQATLVSGTNIKTINSTTLLGSGDIAVATTTQGSNADTAYGWGDHGSEGYLKNVVEDLSPQLGADLDGQSTYDLTNMVDGTFSGNLKVTDAGAFVAGMGNDLSAYHNGITSYITNTTGDLYIQNASSATDLYLDNGVQDRDIIFRYNDGGSTKSTYFDASEDTLKVNYMYVGNDLAVNGYNVSLGAGGATDTVITFNGSSNDGTITYDESLNVFDFGVSTIKAAILNVNGTSSLPVYASATDTDTVGAGGLQGMYYVHRVTTGTVTQSVVGNEYQVLAGVSSGADNNGVARAMRMTAIADNMDGEHQGVYGFNIRCGMQNTSSGTLKNANGIQIDMWSRAGTITDLKGIYITNPFTGGTVTNGYAIYNDSPWGYLSKHPTASDADGGRLMRHTYQGVRTGSIVATTLANIDVAHDGSSDDEKGYVAIYTNDGNDGTSPTFAWKIDSSQVMHYGTHSTIGAETVTGYITIKDASGTTRKLAVVS